MDNTQVQAEQQPPVQGAQPPSGAQPQGGAQQADPKLVNAFQRIMLAVGKYIYAKEVSDHLVEIVRSGQTPIEGIAKATMVVLDNLRRQVKGVNPDFVYACSFNTAVLIAQIAEAAGVIRADPKKMQQYMQALGQALTKELAARQGGQGGQPGAQPAQAAPAGGGDAPHGEMPTGGAPGQDAGAGALAGADEQESADEAASETAVDEEEEKARA